VRECKLGACSAPPLGAQVGILFVPLLSLHVKTGNAAADIDNNTNSVHRWSFSPHYGVSACVRGCADTARMHLFACACVSTGLRKWWHISVLALSSVQVHTCSSVSLNAVSVQFKSTLENCRRYAATPPAPPKGLHKDVYELYDDVCTAVVSRCFCCVLLCSIVMYCTPKSQRLRLYCATLLSLYCVTPLRFSLEDPRYP